MAFEAQAKGDQVGRQDQPNLYTCYDDQPTTEQNVSKGHRQQPEKLPSKSLHYPFQIFPSLNSLGLSLISSSMCQHCHRN